MTLLIATAAVFATSLWVFQQEHSTAEMVRTKTAPAILDVLAAQEALVKADSAAVNSFQNGDNGEVELIGPALEYQSQFTFASQRLVQVAENNVAGGNGSQRIQLLETLFQSYSSLIGQAHAHFGTTAGTTDLWYASHLLHAGDSPIIHELNQLLDDQVAALNGQITASSMTTRNLVKWIVPILLLLVLLVVTQIFLKRHFRRAVNTWLVLATIVLSIATFLTLFSPRPLEAYPDTLNRVESEWRTDISLVDTQGQSALRELVLKRCKSTNDGCGPTVDRFLFNEAPIRRAAAEARGAERVREFNDSINEASSNSLPWFLVPLAAGLVVICIPVGLWPRIEEYRYRPR